MKMENHSIKVKMFDANPDNEPTIYKHFTTSDSVCLTLFSKYISQNKAGIPRVSCPNRHNRYG